MLTDLVVDFARLNNLSNCERGRDESGTCFFSLMDDFGLIDE